MLGNVVEQISWPSGDRTRIFRSADIMYDEWIKKYLNYAGDRYLDALCEENKALRATISMYAYVVYSDNMSSDELRIAHATLNHAYNLVLIKDKNAAELANYLKDKPHLLPIGSKMDYMAVSRKSITQPHRYKYEMSRIKKMIEERGDML